MLNFVCYIFVNISVYSCSLPPALFARLCLGISDTFETLPQPLPAPTPSPAAPVYNVQGIIVLCQKENSNQLPS